MCTADVVSDSPTIQWFGPDGSQITIGVSTFTSTLILTNLTLSDAGEYTCRAELAGVVREATTVFILPGGLKNGMNTG